MSLTNYAISESLADAHCCLCSAVNLPAVPRATSPRRGARNASDTRPPEGALRLSRGNQSTTFPQQTFSRDDLVCHDECHACAPFMGVRNRPCRRLALLPFSFHAERHLETATRVEGSQAETVRHELANRFHSPFVNQVVLVVEGCHQLIRMKADKQ